MMNLFKRSAMVLIAATTLSAMALDTPSIITYAATESTQKAVDVTSLKNISITSKSYMQITDLQFLYGNNEKKVYFTVKIYNGDSKSLDFMDYWVELVTKTGTKYSVKLDEADAKTQKIAPNTFKELHFSANIDPKLNYYNLKIKLIKWDFTLPSYTKNVGEISVPYGFNPVVPALTQKAIYHDNKKITSKLTNARFAVISGKVEGNLTLRLTNSSKQSVSLENIRYYIKRPGGNMYELKVGEVSSNTLSSGATQDIQLYTTLPITKVESNMQLILTASNASNQLETPVAAYAISPANEKTVFVKPKVETTVSISGMNVGTTLRDTYFEESGDSQIISLYTRYTNKGKAVVDLPSYSYYLLSDDGVLYPGTKEQTEVQLVPKVNNDIYVQFKIPMGESAENLKLVVKKTTEDNKNGYVVSLFQLPSKASTQTPTSNMVSYMTTKGLYSFKLLRGERLPWEGDDIVNAVVRVENPQNVIKSLPNLKASIQVNGYKINDADVSLIKVDQINALEGNKSTDYIISAKIPYTFASNDVTVLLYEDTGAANQSALNPISRFKLNNSELLNPKSALSSSSIKINGIGRNSELKVLRFNTYENTTDNTKLVYAEFDYQTLETRLANLPNLQAYFKTKDGNMVKATFKNIKDKVTSSKKSLVMAYAQFPLDFDVSDIQLWIGEGITGQGFTSAGAEAEGFVNATNYQLPVEQASVSKTFDNLLINPYSISMSKLWPAFVDIYKVRIEFEYDMKKLVDYAQTADNHQLVIELVDLNNRFIQKYDLENGNDALKVGEDIKAEVFFEDSKLWGVLYREFTLNIYDEYQGHKKLLATQVINKIGSNF
jgi:hypothetical protein